MVERNGEISHDEVIESLLRKMGVPETSFEIYIKGLRTAFHQDDDPNGRIIIFLQSKVQPKDLSL